MPVPGLTGGRGGIFGAGFFGLAGAEGVDVALLVFEGVVGGGLAGEFVLIGAEVGADFRCDGHGHGGGFRVSL